MLKFPFPTLESQCILKDFEVNSCFYAKRRSSVVENLSLETNESRERESVSVSVCVCVVRCVLCVAATFSRRRQEFVRPPNRPFVGSFVSID